MTSLCTQPGPQTPEFSGVTDDVARIDQRGYARAFGGPRTDIGAYELIDFEKLNSVWLPVLSR